MSGCGCNKNIKIITSTPNNNIVNNTPTTNTVQVNTTNKKEKLRKQLFGR